jgi:hypothetical protein
MTLKVHLEEGKSEKERIESKLREAKTILNDSNKLAEERRSETSSDRGGNVQQHLEDRCCHRTNMNRNKITNYTQTY